MEGFQAAGRSGLGCYSSRRTGRRSENVCLVLYLELVHSTTVVDPSIAMTPSAQSRDVVTAVLNPVVAVRLVISSLPLYAAPFSSPLFPYYCAPLSPWAPLAMDEVGNAVVRVGVFNCGRSDARCRSASEASTRIVRACLH